MYFLLNFVQHSEFDMFNKALYTFINITSLILHVNISSLTAAYTLGLGNYLNESL